MQSDHLINWIFTQRKKYLPSSLFATSVHCISFYLVAWKASALRADVPDPFANLTRQLKAI